jgi:hypothetical protein
MPIANAIWNLSQLESIERDAWLDMFAAAPVDFAKAVGLSSAQIGSAAVFAIRAVPLVQFNHAHALGLDAPLDETALDAVVQELRTRASPVWAVQVPDTPEFANARGWLAAQKFSAAGGWAKFWRPSDPAPLATTTLEICEAGPDRAADFGRMVQEGFGAPPPFAGWSAALVGRPGWRIYVAYDGATPVACGALFLKHGLGWLGLGATLPSHRGRGAQGAILAQRIADAITAGALGLVTETGRPPPGEEGKHPSYRNILRLGFEDVYLRLNYRPAEAL